MLNKQIQVDSQNKKMYGLLAVTYNNLAIYYKRTNKPKAALTYLKNALEIQALKLQDWLASASTHLNICAIYSYMNKHEDAIDHAQLSIQHAQKAKNLLKQLDNRKKDKQQIITQKSCRNIELASHYNLAVEYQHLKNYELAIQTYKKTKQYAKQLGRKNIQTNSQQSIERLASQQMRSRKKIIQLLQKRKDNQEKGNYQSMRRNKKNFRPIQEQSQIKGRKYNIYNDDKKRTQSVGKIVTLQPIRNQSTEGIKRKQQKNTERNINKQSSYQNNKNDEKKQKQQLMKEKRLSKIQVLQKQKQTKSVKK